MDSSIGIVKQFYQELAASNIPGAMRLLDDNFWLIQADSLPYGGVYTGSNGIKDFFQKFAAFWKKFESKQVSYFEDGEVVFATSVAVGTTRYDAEIEMPMVQIYVVKDKKLISAQPFYFDTAQINQK